MFPFWEDVIAPLIEAVDARRIYGARLQPLSDSVVRAATPPRRLE